MDTACWSLICSFLQFCFMQLHRASYVCTLRVDVIELNLNESVKFARCTWVFKYQIDARFNVHVVGCYFCCTILWAAYCGWTKR